MNRIYSSPLARERGAVRSVYSIMKQSYQTWFAVCGVALLSLGFTGCASSSRAVRVTDNLSLYPLYDNERAWGPSYLVGPPQHHFGDETRIDDTRSANIDDSAVDKKPLPPLP